MPKENFIKNITSKDTKLSRSAIKTLIEGCETDNFKELNNKAEFIFPFVKERIIKDFVTLVNIEDLKTVFEFSKIYSSDFEDMIVNSWIKFASEDLTDEILELFETGTVEQRAYGAKYFSRILDSLAVEYLNKEAFSSFNPLKINSAIALSAFNEKEVLNKMKETVLTSEDEFEKVSCLEFINAYGGHDSIKFIVENGMNSSFNYSIFANLLDFNDFNTLKNTLEPIDIIRIFQVLIEAYPENIELNTIAYYEIYNFIKYIETLKNQYGYNVLLYAKSKFIEFYNNEVYSFDLDKNNKNELKKITDYLNSINLPIDIEGLELNYIDDFLRLDCAMEVIKEYKIPLKEKIAFILNEGNIQENILVKLIITLNTLNGLDLLHSKVIEQIQDTNIKALVLSMV